MKGIKLGVNIDHIATIREARAICEPDPLEAIYIAKNAGADQITLHLREDRRHIHDSDVKSIIKHSILPVNVECALDSQVLEYLFSLRPHRLTFVPEKREEITTEGGLDIESNYSTLKDIIKECESNSIYTAIFIEPKKEGVFLAREIGANAVELHTGKYANLYLSAFSNLPYTQHKIKEFSNDRFELYQQLQNELESISVCAKIATNNVDMRAMECFAGHGLNYQNVANIARIPYITELNIGHSIIARAVMVGLERAIIQMKESIWSA